MLDPLALFVGGATQPSHRPIPLSYRRLALLTMHARLTRHAQVQGRNQGLFAAPMAASTADDAIASGSTAAAAAQAAAAPPIAPSLLVEPWPGVVASWGVPKFERQHVVCAPWAAPNVPRGIYPAWMRRLNRAQCGASPAGASLVLEVLQPLRELTLLANHSRHLHAAFAASLRPPPTLTPAPAGAVDATTGAAVAWPRRAVSGDVSQRGQHSRGGGRRHERNRAPPTAAPRRSLTAATVRVAHRLANGTECVALLGIGHVHHTDGPLLKPQRTPRDARRRPPTPSVASAAPFQFGADYDHFFYALSPRPPFAPLAISRDFCLQSVDRPHDCERVQFVSGMALVGGDRPSGVAIKGTRSAHDHDRDPPQRSGSGGRTNETLLLTYGVNDCEARVGRLPLERVWRMLQPLAPAVGAEGSPDARKVCAVLGAQT